jgi:hypothetical protein
MEKDSMGRPFIMGVGYVAALDVCPYRGSDDHGRLGFGWAWLERGYDEGKKGQI